MRTYFKQMIVVIAMLGLVGGCATTKQNSALDRAQKAYSDAKSNADIVASAPVEMRDAEKLILEAQDAKKEADTSRLAYMAEKKVELAKAKTEQKLAEAKAEQLAKENQKAMLEARSREADKSKKEAEKAKQEAEAKAREVERARLEAERLKKETEEKAREVERARLEAEAKSKEAELAKQDAEKARLEAERIREEAKKLEKELAELNAKQTDKGLVLTIGDVLFETAKAELMPGAMRSIDKISAFLNKYPDRKVLIEGHTDSRGGEEYNLRLSERRADSVRSALTSRGIDSNRITTKGYGKNYPVASNETESGRQQNRRVEMIILNEGVTPESVMR